MTITYTIDLSGSEKDRELFEDWENDAQTYFEIDKEKFSFDKENCIVTYSFSDEGE